jgi:hypothetical protein
VVLLVLIGIIRVEKDSQLLIEGLHYHSILHLAWGDIAVAQSRFAHDSLVPGGG